MKQIILFAFLSLSFVIVNAQNIGIGTTTPNTNAALEIKSNNKGLLIPRLSSAGRTGMTNVAKGMMVYDSSLARFYYHDGSKWRLFNENNIDSITKDYINAPEETVNITGSNTTTTANSGILYDNGGPAGNYSNNVYNNYTVSDEGVDSLVGYKVIVEQLNIAAGDALGILVADDQQGLQILTGTTTGTYYFAGTASLVFIFQSDASVTAPGFKIRWSKVIAPKNTSDPAPAFGWYFNSNKIAVRGGISPNNYWIADSLGRLSFAFGANAKAKGKGSVAFGSYVSALGTNSYAFGYISNASGDYSTAIGNNAKASGNYSTAIGQGSKAMGNNSTSIGFANTASGVSALAMGYGNTASADYASAFGYSTLASGTYATSMGKETTASGEKSFAIGNSTTASGFYSFATGLNTIAQGGGSVAMGSNSVAAGDNSIALGLNTKAESFGSVAIGRNTKPVGPGIAAFWDPLDAVLIISNGTVATPNNIVTVLKSGRIGISTDKPDVRLHVDQGADASLADGSGYFVIGDVGGSNLVFDNNEIIARNNGANNTLFLQNNGGAFEIGGTASKPGGGTWTATSDARLKENVKPYSDGLQQLLKIKPVYYNYNKASGYDMTKQYIGVLAQDIKEVAPYMVGTFKKNDTEYYNVDNTAMTYMLINAVKEQQQIIEKQQKQIDAMEKKISGLEKQ